MTSNLGGMQLDHFIFESRSRRVPVRGKHMFDMDGVSERARQVAAQIDFFLRKEREREARFFDWVLNSRERESARTGAEFVRSAETSVMHGKWMLSFAIKRPVILRRPSGTQPTSGPNVRLLTGHKRHSCREGR